MIVKTMQAKRPRGFNMPTLRRRAKKMMRAKYKKTIKLSDLDKILKEYVEYGIKKRLLKMGKVQVDSRFSLEIVGKRIIDDKKMVNLVVSGRNVTNGKLKKAVVFNDKRPDVVYKIVLEDKSYKGNLIFQPDRKLSHAVHQELINTNTYYRIENVSK